MLLGAALGVDVLALYIGTEHHGTLAILHELASSGRFVAGAVH